MSRIFSMLACSIVIGFSYLAAHPSDSLITADQIRDDIRYLASDALEGRLTGTPGNEKAAEYIEEVMEKAHLKPAGDDGGYFQKFDFVSSVKLGSGNALRITGPGIAEPLEPEPDVDFRPLGFSSNATVTGQLVFVGYGISAPDNKYDDYANVDVTGKVVVALRYSPDGSDPRGELNRYSSFRNKARTARDRGAAALILVTGPVDEKEDEIIRLSFDHSFASSGIPAVSMKRALLEQLLRPTGHTLKDIQDSIRSSRKPMSFAINGTSAALTTDVEQITGESSNVAGYIEGNDPALKNQVVIIGAHFDHLGYGGPGSGSLAPDTVAVHHGADDNASGTAGLLALIRAYATDPSNLKRTTLFLAFTGEELGELGSAHYVNHPFFSLDRTVVMVNMDMIGRLQNRSLSVYGTGTSPAWQTILTKENADSTFKLNEIADGFGPSDQAQFYGKDLPVLFFFTGTHNDYHKPSDEWETINTAGETQVVRYVYRIVNDIEALPDRPQFTKVMTSAPTGGGDTRGFSVTLGIVPDFGEAKEGMKIGGIRPGGPAEKAGLKSGDIIVSLAGKKVMNIYDYMGVLGELKPGDEVAVEVLRDGKPMRVTTVMQKRK